MTRRSAKQPTKPGLETVRRHLRRLAAELAAPSVRKALLDIGIDPDELLVLLSERMMAGETAKAE